MQSKILAVTCFAFSALAWRVISHADTALFYSILFFIIGIYEFTNGIRAGSRSRDTTGVDPS